MRRVEQGEKRRRAAVLQDMISISVAGFGFFAEGELCGPIFVENVGTVLGPKIC